MAKVTAETLGAEIEKLLEDYANEAAESMKEIAKKVGQKGAQAIKNDARSSFGGSGEYASGWKYKDISEDRLTISGVIYNANVPSLPHLLEHGHAKRGGGRVAGRAHIAPVEKEIIESFEKEIMAKL